MVYCTDQAQTFLGRDLGQGKVYSEAIATEIDSEVRDIVEDGYETARRILTEHMPELHKLAKYLMEREKISGDEFKIIMEGGEPPPLEEPEAAPKAAEVPAAPEAEADGQNAPRESAAPETAQEQPGENPENQEPKL